MQITSRDPAPPPVAYLVRSGGMFLDMTIHDFDMARFVTGSEVVEVYGGRCRAGRPGDRRRRRHRHGGRHAAPRLGVPDGDRQQPAGGVRLRPARRGVRQRRHGGVRQPAGALHDAPRRHRVAPAADRRVLPRPLRGELPRPVAGVRRGGGGRRSGAGDGGRRAGGAVGGDRRRGVPAHRSPGRPRAMVRRDRALALALVLRLRPTGRVDTRVGSGRPGARAAQDGSSIIVSRGSSSRSWSDDAGEHEARCRRRRAPTGAGRGRSSRWRRRSPAAGRAAREKRRTGMRRSTCWSMP